MDEILPDRLDAYVRYHETMTDKTAGLGAKYFSKEARFLSPDRELSGRQDIVEFFMARRQNAASYRFKVIDALWGQDGQTAYWRWDMVMTDLRGRKTNLSGMSEITFDLKARIISQIDYYDGLRAVHRRNKLAAWLLRKFS